MELAHQEYFKMNGLSLIIFSSQLLSKHIPVTHGSNARNSSPSNRVDNILQSGNCTFSHHLVSFLPILTQWILENWEWFNAGVCKLLWSCIPPFHSRVHNSSGLIEIQNFSMTMQTINVKLNSANTVELHSMANTNTLLICSSRVN